MTRAQDTLSTEDLQVLSGMPSNKIAGRHIRKLVQVINSKLKKDLISAMDEANIAKEKAKVLSDELRAKRQLALEKD